jgi:hypothetical protein
MRIKSTRPLFAWRRPNHLLTAPLARAQTLLYRVPTSNFETSSLVSIDSRRGIGAALRCLSDYIGVFKIEYF